MPCHECGFGKLGERLRIAPSFSHHPPFVSFTSFDQQAPSLSLLTWVLRDMYVTIVRSNVAVEDVEDDEEMREKAYNFDFLRRKAK